MDREDMRRMARGWGRVADAYVDELFDELDRKPADRALLADFATRVLEGLPVADVGCGPGHVARHLKTLGLDTVGIDLCPEMVERAQALTPDARFEVGDMLSLPHPDASWGGAIALYSLINLRREDVPDALGEIARVLRPGAPLLLAVHRGEGVHEAEELFGEPVRMVVTLFEPDEIRALLMNAGFAVSWVRTRPPYPEEYPSERVYALGVRT
ncbi:MAG: class I SAM-dependent methyltransferase [Planctomycetota bacterium]|nr:class I SAM-dependent methyltransferase [Planctomycetota bacterium]